MMNLFKSNLNYVCIVLEVQNYQKNMNGFVLVVKTMILNNKMNLQKFHGKKTS